MITRRVGKKLQAPRYASSHLVATVWPFGHFNLRNIDEMGIKKTLDEMLQAFAMHSRIIREKWIKRICLRRDISLGLGPPPAPGFSQVNVDVLLDPEEGKLGIRFFGGLVTDPPVFENVRIGGSLSQDWRFAPLHQERIKFSLQKRRISIIFL